MAEKENERILVDGTLDVRGESCPYPAMYTLDAINNLEPGKILEVVADCPQSFINVPDAAIRHGHKVLSTVKDGTNLYFYIEVC